MDMGETRWSESNQALVEEIRDEILASGPIRFDRFMELVLYHEQHGYYRSAQSRPGRSGDFITAPEAHPIFGATLAAQIVDFDYLLGHPDRFCIIEYGAGAGRLIRPLLAELQQVHPHLYERVTYYPIEINQQRRAELHEHLASGGHADRLASAPPASATGCILANEFLDAFPARRITLHNGEPMEAFVTWVDDWFAEALRPVDDLAVLDYLDRHAFIPEDGEWVEFQPAIATWLDEAGRHIDRGYLLIIDYGYPATELFSDHRRAGTLKGYYQHGVTKEIYRGAGEQDLTVHVNLSEVTTHAVARGFVEIGMTAQAELLAALGIGDRLVRLMQQPGIGSDDYLAVRSAVLRMIDPGAMGRFRALYLGRNVDPEAKPLGLRGRSDPT